MTAVKKNEAFSLFFFLPFPSIVTITSREDPLLQMNRSTVVSQFSLLDKKYPRYFYLVFDLGWLKKKMLLAIAAFDPRLFFHLVHLTLHFVFPSATLSKILQDTNLTAFHQKGNDCKINRTHQQLCGKRQQLKVRRDHPCATSAGHFKVNLSWNQKNLVIKPKSPRIYCTFSMTAHVIRNKYVGTHINAPFQPLCPSTLITTHSFTSTPTCPEEDTGRDVPLWPLLGLLGHPARLETKNSS